MSTATHYKVLRGLPRSEVQKLAMRAGLKANDKTEDIILRLLAQDSEGGPPHVEEVKHLRRSARVAKSASHAVKQEVAGVADMATEESVVVLRHMEASGSKTRQDDNTIQRLHESAEERPRALKALDVHPGASSSRVSKIARDVGQSTASAARTTSTQGAITHGILYQQTGQGSSSDHRAPSATVDLSDVRSAPGLHYANNPPPTQSAAGSTPWAGLSGSFTYIATTDSWFAAAPHAEMQVSRLVPAQRPAPVAMRAPATAVTMQGAPDSAAQSAPAPMPQPVNLRKIKSDLEKAMETIAAEFHSFTANRLGIGQHDPAPFDQTARAPNPRYSEPQQGEKEARAWCVGQDVAALSSGEESEDVGFS
ncbi:hypothetical protein B0H21DRAFT_895586 [Amylocystis lapponica]|nr:hypothetical protein B0H21DRAFT_895586 [Amylocystis lapponica]